MHSTQMNIGDCPECGDELYIFRTKSRKRLAKCINEDCPVHKIYGVPKAGNIEVTGLICPKNELPLLAVVPNIRLKQGKYKQEKSRVYFWTDHPCFTCSEQNSCEVLSDAKEDYE